MSKQIKKALRQRDTKPEEWEAYNAYCEECKNEARKTVYEEALS